MPGCHAQEVSIPHLRSVINKWPSQAGRFVKSPRHTLYPPSFLMSPTPFGPLYVLWQKANHVMAISSHQKKKKNHTMKPHFSFSHEVLPGLSTNMDGTPWWPALDGNSRECPCYTCKPPVQLCNDKMIAWITLEIFKNLPWSDSLCVQRQMATLLPLEYIVRHPVC